MLTYPPFFSIPGRPEVSINFEAVYSLTERYHLNLRSASTLDKLSKFITTVIRPGEDVSAAASIFFSENPDAAIALVSAGIVGVAAIIFAPELLAFVGGIAALTGESIATVAGVLLSLVRIATTLRLAN